MLGGKHLVRRSLELAMATDKSFRFSDVRLYSFLASQVDYDYKYSASKRYIAEEMRLSRRQIYASIKSLQEKDIIREQLVNGQWTYYLNPYYIRSENKKHTEELIEIYEAIEPAVPIDHTFRAKCEEHEKTL